MAAKNLERNKHTIKKMKHKYRSFWFMNLKRPNPWNMEQVPYHLKAILIILIWLEYSIQAVITMEAK
jgi:archaellum component FlaD/FlaE